MTTRANISRLVGAEILPGDETDAIKAAVEALAALISGGKLPVDIGSSLVNVDMATVDVDAIVDGIAGVPPKTLFDIEGGIAAINTALAPTGATALATAATTGVGTVDTITLTADTIYVDIQFDTAAHYATPGTSAPGTTEGCKYAPGITYRIYTYGATNLYVESAGAAGNYYATCYTHA